MRTVSARPRLLAVLVLTAVALACADAPSPAPDGPPADLAADLPLVLTDTARADAPAWLSARAVAAPSPVRVVSSTVLGALRGYDGEPHPGLNNAGQVVGTRYDEGAERLRPFIWTRAAGARDLAAPGWLLLINDPGVLVGLTLPLPGFQPTAWVRAPGADARLLPRLPGAIQTVPWDINNAGQIVGWSGSECEHVIAASRLPHESRAPRAAAVPVCASHAFFWDARTDQMADLGTLGGFWSEARAVNDAGQVVGMGVTRGGEIHAFLWERGVGLRDIGPPSGGQSAAFGINNAGQVVGYVSNREGGFVAARWTRESGWVAFEAGSLNSNGAALSINASGHAVGMSADGHPTLWLPDGTAIDLGLPPGIEGAHATGINDAGLVTGTGSQGLVWDVRIAGAPAVSRLQAARLPAGVYPQYARDGGVWLRVRLTDADTPMPGPWAWRIDWGDGVVHTPTVALKGEFAFVRATPYASAGPHTITVTATDPAGVSSAPAITVAR